VETQPCAAPGCGRRAWEYHHVRGYDPAHSLDVVPLCKSHHTRVHLRLEQPLGGLPGRVTREDAQENTERVEESSGEAIAAARAKAAAVEARRDAEDAAAGWEAIMGLGDSGGAPITDATHGR
jgi:hypothetical protein